ncbi:unnamed protein product [Rotaria sp. Silwood2]|nr:unnamed protein product [Rotaria sp. Silwood2]CAF2634579.1 unnamed protein product [Rotaria sp. Silwood2]CAF2887007.1 unnamed protein product [Rotaria sp. Silwood2]CAF3105435.1 unnamed protein product [Rotaria sp. Silwood2]CAF4317343.1 unnamed protein product [Rotaria sp. Silwood2]
MTFFCIIFLLATVQPTYQVLYSCNSSVACGCSSSPVSISRIVGGEDAGASAWSWAVSISIDGDYLCGGSIISNSWIITAAHCVENSLASSVTIYAGSNNRWSGIQNRTVSQIIIHPYYNSHTFTNDIALLKLTSPLNMSDDHLSRICMPLISSAILASGKWPVANTIVVAVGWGRLSEGGSFPTSLQQVTLQTIDYLVSTCASMIEDKRTQFCAGAPGYIKDTCQGDSGGPLMMFTTSNQWVLVGLTSSGIGCARSSYSGLYTRVAVYKDWIISYTNDSFWLAMGSHANTVSIPIGHLFFFLGLISLLTFHP